VPEVTIESVSTPPGRLGLGVVGAGQHGAHASGADHAEAEASRRCTHGLYCHLWDGVPDESWSTAPGTRGAAGVLGPGGSVVAGGRDVSCCSGASGTGPSEAGPSGAGPSGAGPSGAGPPGVGRGVGLGKIPPYTVGTVGAAGAPVFSIHRSG